MSETSTAALRAESLPSRAQRRNFGVLFSDYVLFGIAFAILNPNVMPPDFVAQMGGGPVLVGFAGLAFRVAWLFPQLFFAPWVNRASHKRRYVVLPSLPGRSIYIPAGLLMIAVGPSQPGMLIALLLGSMAFMAFCDGLSVVAWMDVLATSLTNNQRSTFFGVAQATVGIIVSLAVTPLVRLVLGPAGPPLPTNYALLLIIASVLLLLGLIAYARLEEGASPPPEDSPSFREYRIFLGKLLQTDLNFRKYMLTRFALDLSTIGLPFYIVFATTRLGQASAVAISDQILLVTISGILAALLFSRLNQRFGPRTVIVAACVAATASPLLILSTGLLGILGLHLMWITVGMVNAAFAAGFLNWVVEYAPEGDRPIYSGVANTIGAFALIAPVLGGLIVQALSYDALFLVGAVLGVLAIILALRLPEPRQLKTDSIQL